MTIEQPTIEELQAEIRLRDDKMKRLIQERDEARELVDKMRDRLQDNDALIESWIEVFQLTQDDAGVYRFDPHQTDLWLRHSELNEKHDKLIREWNRFVTKYNAKVDPRDIGRPLAASDAQVAEVRKLQKNGESLRAIASKTSLSLRTVRTIVEKAAGKDRAAKRGGELRKMEFDRLRAAAFRSRKALREKLPKDITDARKAAAALAKAAKGLGQD